VPTQNKKEAGNPDRSNMNNNKKNRSRGGNNTMGRSERGQGGGNNNSSSKQSKSPEKEASSAPVPKENSPSEGGEFDGIYRNARFTWALTSLIGETLRVFTATQDEYEGILKTFSPNIDIVLEQCHKVDPHKDKEIDYTSVYEKHVFPIKNIMMYCAKEVDLEFAMKESFLTDTQISQTRVNGETGLKELEVWQPEEGDKCMGIEDDMHASNGWSANEMFAKNEERFGVKTSYDPTLTGYTTQLNRDKLDSDVERQAARIAADIEGEGNSRFNAELENGDEEEAFSAVVRPSDRRNGGRERESPGDDKPQAYIPPNKRDGGGSGRGSYSRGRGQRTPPPRGYDNSYDDREHRQRDDRRDRYGGNRSRDSYDRGYHDNRNSYREDRGYGRQDSHGKKEDYNRYSDSGPRSQDKYRNERPPNSNDGRRDDRKSIEKVSPLPPHHLERQKSGDRNRSPANNAGGQDGMDGALPQRTDGRRKAEKTKDQIKEEMQNFHDNFKLKINDGAGQQHATPPHHHNQQPPVMSPSTPTVSINTISGGSAEQSERPSVSPRSDRPSTSPHSGRNDQGRSGGGTSPRGGMGGAATPSDNKSISATPKQTSPAQQQQQTPGPSHNQSMNQSAANTPVVAANITSTPSSGGNAAHGQQGGLPPQTPDSGKKSTLNPNAKEFTLNPTAKEFTPGKFMGAPRPSPTPPRVQTPVQHMTPTIYHVPVPAQPFGQQMVTAVPLTSAQQQRPMRPNSKEGGGLRADLTGPPIIQQPSYYPPAHVGGQIQYMPAPPHQMLRMQMMPPGAAAMGMIQGNMIPISAPAQIGGQQVPGAGEQAHPQQPQGPHSVGAAGMQQTMIPVSQHYQQSPAQPGQPQQQAQQQQQQPQQVHGMWQQQVMSTPSPMHPPSGAPPPQGVAVPPQNTMTATPPNPVQVGGGGPAPSPGPQIMGYPPTAAGQNFQGPMILMPAGGTIPFHHQTHGASPGGAPGLPGAAPGQILHGAPVTSLPHQQYLQMAAGAQPFLVGQAPPHPQ